LQQVRGSWVHQYCWGPVSIHATHHGCWDARQGSGVLLALLQVVYMVSAAPQQLLWL
jgi:hypothetical protein